MERLPTPVNLARVKAETITGSMPSISARKHRLPLLTIDEKIHALVGVRGLKVVW